MQILEGMVTDDPAQAATIGQRFRVNFKQCPPLVAKGFGDLSPWDHLGTMLLGLSFQSSAGLRPDGSAVLIGPGIALAAKHVFDPLMSAIMESEIVPMAYSIAADRVLLWSISQIIFAENDVVILRLNLASDFPPDGFQAATLTTRTPALGEPVMIVGIRGEHETPANEAFPIQVLVAVGEVTNLYHTGRDRVLLPHPCIEIRCLSVGGMSGGPAFDKDGNLLGILSSSIDHKDGPSFVSLWWPLAAAKIDSIWPPGIVPLPTSLLALQHAKVLAIVNADALHDDGLGSLSYKTWT